MPARISGWRVDERVEEGRGLHSSSLWQLSGMQLFLGKASSWRGTKTQCFTRLDSVTASLVCYWKIIYCHLSSKVNTTLPHKVLLLPLTSAYSSASSQTNGWRWRQGWHKEVCNKTRATTITAQQQWPLLPWHSSNQWSPSFLLPLVIINQD